jgi:outer membrane protein assembly factor BamA
MTLRAGFEDNDIGTNTVAERVLSTQIQELPQCSSTLTSGCLNAEESRALRVPVGKTSFTVLGLDFSLDLRNSAFNPTSGARISGGVSWIRSTTHAKMDHRVWADNEAAKTWTTWAFSNLLRATLAVSAYIPLGTPRVVLMLYGGAGYIAQLQSGSETFADRLFYLGGGHTLRGFPEESLCARESSSYDTPGKKVCIYGGNLMVNYKIELQLSVYRELGLVVFSDLGNLWREPKSFSPIDLRATVGVGIKYATPIGPINLAYGFVLLRDKDRGEPFGSLHFSIGAI